jgi:hypothetical protein
MKQRLDKLLTIKSLVTLSLCSVFCILSLRGTVTGQEFLTIFTTVIAFYFGTQTAKNDKKDES